MTTKHALPGSLAIAIGTDEIVVTIVVRMSSSSIDIRESTPEPGKGRNAGAPGPISRVGDGTMSDASNRAVRKPRTGPTLPHGDRPPRPLGSPAFDRRCRLSLEHGQRGG